MKLLLVSVFVCFKRIFPLIDSVFITISIKKCSKKIHLLTYGILTSRKVVRKEPTKTGINKQTVYKVFFQFMLQNNTIQENYVKTALTHNLCD
jgi:hypothetical protein